MKFVKVVTWINKDNTTFSKVNLISDQGVITKSFIGEAKLNPEDQYDEQTGNRMAELRAFQLAHKFVKAEARKVYEINKKAATAAAKAKALSDKTTLKLNNIEIALKDIFTKK